MNISSFQTSLVWRQVVFCAVEAHFRKIPGVYHQQYHFKEKWFRPLRNLIFYKLHHQTSANNMQLISAFDFQ